MNVEGLEGEYARLTEETEKAWAQQKLSGNFIGLPLGYHKLGLTIGSFWKPEAPIAAFLAPLEQIASVDSALVLVPRASMHFTLLALSGHMWDRIDELPTDVGDLKKIVSRRLGEHSWALQDLRLVPGRNYLLLAGIPDAASLRIRDRLIEDLLGTKWEAYLRRRYPGALFPPRIWHTTLARYEHEYFPGSVRELFRQFRNERFGGLLLEKAALRAVTYDWSTALRV